MHGQPASFASLTLKDSLVLVVFWSLTSDESINELNAVNANFEGWKEKIHFKMMAVSIDEGKAANRVRPTAIGNGWTFDIFVDLDGNLRKALSSSNLPQAFIIKNGRSMYQQSGYDAGTEKYLFEKLAEFSEK